MYFYISVLLFTTEENISDQFIIYHSVTFACTGHHQNSLPHNHQPRMKSTETLTDLWGFQMKYQMAKAPSLLSKQTDRQMNRCVDVDKFAVNRQQVQNNLYCKNEKLCM